MFCNFSEWLQKPSWDQQIINSFHINETCEYNVEKFNSFLDNNAQAKVKTNDN